MKTQEKGLLLLYLRQLFPLSHSKSFDAILSYKHDVTNLYLPCDFQEIIEIPIYENDSFCEFKFQIYLEEEDFSNNVKFTFEELNLSSDSIKTFSLELTFKAYKFFLIFDAYFKSSLTESKNNNNNVMMVKVHQLKDITMFLKKRQLVNREKQILRKNISDYKYFIELRYFEQKFALELSLEELNNLNLREFYFIYNIKELTHPFTVEILECEYEKLTPEDDLTFLGSLTLESHTKSLKEILNSEFVVEDTVYNLTITFQTSSITSEYLSKMPSYTGIKLLSSAFFDSSLKDSQMFVHCLNTQASWLISPMQSETANNKSFFIWNPQNSLINSKALQTLNPENENKIEFNKEEMASAKIVHLKKMSPLAKFEALLLKYRYLEKYDKILNDDNLPFQNKLNEIVFINESPYDYVTFTLFDGITKEKKGICQVCLMDLEENKLNLEFLLDPKLNIIVGTISFLVEFRSCQSNNAKNLDFYKTINTTQMLNYDDFNKLNYTRILSNNYGYYYEMERNMREFRGNYFTNSTKIVKFHIEIDEIWNCFELIDIPEIVYQDRNLAIICKIGIYSYSIPINILTFTFDKIKNNHPEIYKALINESQMQYVEKKNIKNSETAILNIYFLSKKPNEIMMISLEKNSNFWVIIENPCIMISLQLVQKKEIIKFYKAFMKDLLIFKEKGVLILGMEVNNLKKKKNLGFNSSMIFAKFLYEIKEDLDYSKENFSEGLYQIYLVNDERNINKNQLQELVQMNYEISIKDQESKTIMKKLLKFKGTLEGNMLLSLYEINMSGGLKFTIEVNRLFSDDDEEYQLNKLINGINSKTKLVFSSIVLLNFLDVKQNSKTLKSDIYPNSYKILNFLVQDNRISLKAQEAKPDIEFPLSIIINYKCNQFLENFESSLILEIPENTLKYYLGNGYATPTNSLKFNTLSSGAKQTVIFSFKENFNSSTNQIGSKIALNIKKYTQIILVQLLNADNSISDSYSIKISDLLYYFNDQNSFQQTLLFHNKPFVVLFKLERGGLNEKKTQSEASRSQEISKLEDKKSKADKDQNGSENKNKKKGEGSDLDQLKSKIQNLKKENANLTTQLCREQKITILKHKTIEELEVIINRKEVNNSLNAEKKKSKPLDQAKINKTKELFNSICVCGAGYPKFKGYCIECLKKLKSEYEKALNEYLPLNDKLENISQKNMNHISKMTQIRKKIQSLKIKIKNFDLENTGENEDKFLQDDLNYYKEKKILLKAELELINKKYEKIIVSKRNEQKETEQKLIIKSEKLQRIIEETENYILKIKEMKNEIVRMSDKLLVEDKEKKQKPENNL